MACHSLSLLVARCLLFVYLLLRVACWSLWLVACCCLLDVVGCSGSRLSLCVVRCSSLVSVCCSLFDVCYVFLF